MPLALLTMVAVAAISTSPIATASDPEAWKAFQKETQTRCVKALRTSGNVLPKEEVQVKVSAYGSESFGMALITRPMARDHRQFLCTMDKRTKRIEFAEL